jgi:hypothetical protein
MARASLAFVDHASDRPPTTSLRERVAVSLLRTTSDLAVARQVTVDRIAAEPAGLYRDRALAGLATGAWSESALLWLAWRLLPHRTLVGPIS